MDTTAATYHIPHTSSSIGQHCIDLKMTAASADLNRPASFFPVQVQQYCSCIIACTVRLRRKRARVEAPLVLHNRTVQHVTSHTRVYNPSCFLKEVTILSSRHAIPLIIFVKPYQMVYGGKLLTQDLVPHA